MIACGKIAINDIMDIGIHVTGMPVVLLLAWTMASRLAMLDVDVLRLVRNSKLKETVLVYTQWNYLFRLRSLS